ncbi:MAG TPA: hypothetical protein VLH36_04210, partial [Steroidobacteraceae bacterium]|nr:hypothetical protein [Steroidobacteraceae bacterium]
MTNPDSERGKLRFPRSLGISIAVWLVSGFALMIAAFVTGSLLASRGADHATDELVEVRSEIELLTSTARELGESSTAFDRAVLAFLGTDSPENRATLVAAGERLSRAANAAPQPG